MPVLDDVLAVAAARVEEQARGQRADDDRSGDRQQDAGGHENEGERVDLHDREMVGPPARAEVGPKVTTLLGRRRFLSAAAVLIASACAPAALKVAPTPVPLPALGADPKNGIWPAQYLRAAAPVREAYSWAIAHEPTLRFIPCYCGCGEDGHTSNYSCYVQQVMAGGRVILDPHGFG